MTRMGWIIGGIMLGAALCVGAYNFADPAWALVTANSFVTPQTPNVGVVQYTQGTGSDGAGGIPKTLYTGGTNGSKCVSLQENNSDQTQTHLVTIFIVHTTTSVGTTFTTTLSSGATVFGTAVDVMSTTNWPGLPRDGAGNPYIFLASGDTLRVQFSSALTATDAIHFVAFCSDF